MSGRVRGGGNHAAAVPAAIAGYFGVTKAPSRVDHPWVERLFFPARGWVPVAGEQRVSGNYLRRQRLAGATSVAVRLGTRVADFKIEEVTR